MDYYEREYKRLKNEQEYTCSKCGKWVGTSGRDKLDGCMADGTEIIRVWCKCGNNWSIYN